MDPLMLERVSKIEEIKKLGIPAYAVSFNESTTTVDIQKNSKESDFRQVDEIQADPKNSIKLAGRLMTFREHGKISFGTIQDECGKIQVCFLRGFTKIEGIDSDDGKVYEHFWKKLIDLGDYLGVTGDLFKTKHGETTILVHSLTFLSKAIRPLPEKWHGIVGQENCYRERNLDLISNPETRDRFTKRSAIVREIRNFFYDKKFHEVETRTLQPQAGGAMAKVFTTHHNALDHDFVLRIALELDLKMTLSGGFDRIFEIGKNFRNEGTDPSHLQEFTMIEWYAAYDTLDLHEKWIEELFGNICKNVFHKTVFEILDKNENPVTVDFSKPFQKVSFSDLLKKYANIDMSTISDDDLRKKAKILDIEHIQSRSRGNLLDDIYKKTARPHLLQPTFVVNWPSELKPLAKPNTDGTSAVSQLLIAGWEVTNGYNELIDPILQRKLLENQQKARSGGDEEAMEVDEVFLKAMEHGFPPMTGNAIGIDRLCALLSGMPNLRDVILFPTMKPVSGNTDQEARNIEQKEEVQQLQQAEDKNVDTEQPLPDGARKFVAVLNKKVEPGKLMNALGHMSAGISGMNPAEKQFLEYRDADQGIHPHVSHFPFIILRADNSNKLRTLRKAAKDAGITCTDFTNTMTVGTSAAQLQATKNTPEQDLEYFGVCLFGDSEKIDPLTKKFSLWR